MSLSIFKETFTNSLRTSIATNLRRYEEDEAWAGSLGVAISRDLPTSLEPKAPLELLVPDADGLHDFENSIRLHKAFPNLTPLQARDPRLWARLTHVELWPYMRKRWDVTPYATLAEKAARFIETRYFIPRSESRSVIRNGASRLWWAAALSFDKDRDNPYELTRVLLSTLDITQQLLERNFGRAQSVTKGFLQFLLRNEAALLRGGDVARNHIRHLAKYVNLYGGVCILDALSEADVIALLETEYLRISAAEPTPEPAAV